MIRFNQAVKIVVGDSGNNGVLKCSSSCRPVLVFNEFHLPKKFSFSENGERSFHAEFCDFGDFHPSVEDQIEPFTASILVEYDRPGAKPLFLHGFGNFREVIIADILEEG